jgi:hypothetical protein
VRRGLRRPGRPRVHHPAAANRDFCIHGPQPLTLRQALGIYRQIVVPDQRLITVPLPVMSAIDRLFMGGKLAPSLQIMGLLARLGEHGDPAPANELLGAPTTTVEDWCRAQLPLSSVNGAQA